LEGLGVTIGSAATLLSELLGGVRRRHHSPGAKGLPGGYPIRLSLFGDVSLDLPSNIDEQQAVEINKLAQTLDGIFHVEPGRVIATQVAQDAYKEIVGGNLPEAVTPSIVIDLAQDAIERLNQRFNLGLKI
jgi:hypothetical protein